MAWSTRGDYNEHTIILEAVASQHLWICHAFGVTISNNDINISQSIDVLLENEVAVHFVTNNAHYTRGYYLTDDIYPDWTVFVKSFPFSSNQKKRRFKVMQETAIKDVERAFGVLQARWGIVKGSARLWKNEQMSNIIWLSQYGEWVLKSTSTRGAKEPDHRRLEVAPRAGDRCSATPG
ncbi:uncharacterized protein LOC131023420 [Salvia miltiorrhiza]|uniref:uncharacterized protein LOC131023420 n=1 Tax=Salvia miltiorrhiza TaxID=226208 RepID=UPI0025AC604F|nr:uncharacterized protein LOC131023420 [Salvia miltiorrhiza]